MKENITGSSIARSGFKNEDDVVGHFNNWKNSTLAKKWLEDLNVQQENIESVSAKRIHKEKTDVLVNIKICGFSNPFNIQVKLVSIKKGFNQVDKRWVDDYHRLWNFPSPVLTALKKFTGEIRPLSKSKDHRRLFFDELERHELELTLRFFESNKIKVISDILAGSGPMAARFVLVIDKSGNNLNTKILSIKKAISIISEGPVVQSPRGSLKIGKISMQRKGGDGGKPSANMLQFKENPQDFLV
ncbi:MAG TPA: type II restriction endonuclease [Chitinophagaceae bacterium]|nr:type II restriction endonuclease [Pseudomonadota bacterium]HAL95872.1 type II restriction endonuclease [Chitinophagaceae bacterium]